MSGRVSIILDSELQTVDFTLHSKLSRLNTLADQLEEKESDKIFDHTNWTTLEAAGLLSADHAQALIEQYQTAEIFLKSKVPETYPNSFDRFASEAPSARQTTSDKAQADRAKADHYFGDIEVRNFDAVKKRIIRLVRSGDIQKDEAAWAVHLYFTTFLQYEKSPQTATDLRSAVAAGVYDCSEYTEGQQEVLNALKIPNTAVVYQDNESTYHAFLMYEANGQWGYASVASFSAPRFADADEIYRAWSWDLYGEYFYSGRLQKGQFKTLAAAYFLPATANIGTSR